MPLTYAWAKENARIYINAHACSTWTKPSHLTMLTGLLQGEHGVEYKESFIPDDLVMIQERLKDIGYQTHAYTGSAFLSGEWGFDRGFDTFRENPWHPVDYEADEFDAEHVHLWDKSEFVLIDDGIAFDRALDDLQRICSQQSPVFLLVHTYMVHQYWTAFVPDAANKTHADAYRYFKENASIEQRRSLYADSVARCDAKLANFIERLQSQFPKPIIFLTSDHGEGLGEVYDSHVSFYHTQPPYHVQTHVPLVVSGLGTGISDQLVGLDDMANAFTTLATAENGAAHSLFTQREHVLAEFKPLTRGNSIRYVATIGRHERSMEKIDEKEIPYQSPTKGISKALRRQLEALGYLE
jgi:arylsulfatase A-like enzyme